MTCAARVCACRQFPPRSAPSAVVLSGCPSLGDASEQLAARGLSLACRLRIPSVNRCRITDGVPRIQDATEETPPLRGLEFLR